MPRQAGVFYDNVTLNEAKEKLPELLNELRPGEEMIISDHGMPLARVRKIERLSWPCKAGSYQKKEFWMAADFDAPLDEFREYME